MRVALCQMNSGEDVEQNVGVAEELLEQAAVGGADLAGLPETFPYMGSKGAEVAQPVPGPITDRLAAAARRHHMWVLGGSLLESAGGKTFNTSVLFDREGAQAATYRKIHLFDVDLPGQAPFRESDTFTSGDLVVVADTEFGRMGMTICYDLRFPELYRALADRRADILTVPAAFTYHTGKDHWEVLLRARAIENQALVIAPAMWGEWGPPEQKRRCYGNSMVVDPWGRMVARASDGVGVTIAEVDLDVIPTVRAQIPALANRRLPLVT